MNKIDTSNLTEAQATLLMPLWARALEARQATPILRDRKAVEIVESLDFDFESFNQKGVPQADYCIRGAVLDQLVSEFLTLHPSGTVVEFGVGLDARFDRLDNGQVSWIELDLPHVIELRRKFFQTSPRRHILTGSLTDERWIAEVAALVVGPTLFIAEGVLYFLTPAQVQALIKNLVANFPRASFMFDAQSPWYLWFSNLRQPVPDAQMTFSVGDVGTLAREHLGLRVKRWGGYGDSPYYDQKLKRLGVVKRWGRRLCPPVRGLFKIIELAW
ncbi:MAG: class I SAM-dependent methyltransferase [Pirellulaceae bacterium]|nr:class I SAM-dependent methyltransferase [Pirellulaceae bacterium]